MHGPTCVRPSNAQKARTALLVVMSPRTPSMSRKEHSSLQTTQKRQYRGERSGAVGAAGAPRRGWSVPHVNSHAHPILSLRSWGSHPCNRFLSIPRNHRNVCTAWRTVPARCTAPSPAHLIFSFSSLGTCTLASMLRAASSFCRRASWSGSTAGQGGGGTRADQHGSRSARPLCKGPPACTRSYMLQQGSSSADHRPGQCRLPLPTLGGKGVGVALVGYPVHHHLRALAHIHQGGHVHCTEPEQGGASGSRVRLGEGEVRAVAAEA